MQKYLTDYNDLEIDQNLSKKIRDINYKETINKNSTSLQRNVVDKIISGHPEGITDIEICVITGFSRNIVNARRNEIKDVMPVGIAVYIDDYGGNHHLNTLWGKNINIC